MDTWQTVYKQLQELLNECIKLWWKYKFLYDEDNDTEDRIDYFYSEDWYCTKEGISNWRELYDHEIISYHDLFSVESWIMEFIWPTTEYTYVNEYWKICNHHKSNKSHYHKMSMMTSDMKIRYFLSNAKLQTKSE